MRKHCLFVLTGIVALLVSSCKTYDDATAPSKSAFTVDMTSGYSDVTEFTFTVNQVSAKAIALLPYGDGTPGILISPESFTDGKATVKFKYTNIGDFQAVVKTTNYAPDGKTIQSVLSEAIPIQITSDDCSITSFSFSGPNSTSTTIWDKVSTNSDTILVTLPYNPYNTKGVTALKANFSLSKFATAKIGSTEQVSGTTANDFTLTQTYVVTSASGQKTKTYLVNVAVMAAGAGNAVKSASGKVYDHNGDFDTKSFDAYVDNVNNIIAVVLPNEASAAATDSIQFSYVLTDTTSRGDIKQKAYLNLAGTNNATLKVTAQNGSQVTYTVYGVVAPKLQFTITNLNPQVVGKTTQFGINLTCLKGTDLSSLNFDYTVTEVGTSATQAVLYNNATFTDGSAVDFSTNSSQSFMLKVNDEGMTYLATYTVSIVTVP